MVGFPFGPLKVSAVVGLFRVFGFWILFTFSTGLKKKGGFLPHQGLSSTPGQNRPVCFFLLRVTPRGLVVLLAPMLLCFRVGGVSARQHAIALTLLKRLPLASLQADVVALGAAISACGSSWQTSEAGACRNGAPSGCCRNRCG